MTEATAEYRKAENEIERFIESNFVINSGFILPAVEAYEIYSEWSGEMTRKEFVQKIEQRFKRRKHSVGKHRFKYVYYGLGNPPESAESVGRNPPFWPLLCRLCHVCRLW